MPPLLGIIISQLWTKVKEEISLAMERGHSSFVSEAAIPVLCSVLGVAGTADQSLRTHSLVRK